MRYVGSGSAAGFSVLLFGGWRVGGWKAALVSPNAEIMEECAARVSAEEAYRAAAQRWFSKYGKLPAVIGGSKGYGKGKDVGYLSHDGCFTRGT